VLENILKPNEIIFHGVKRRSFMGKNESSKYSGFSNTDINMMIAKLLNLDFTKFNDIDNPNFCGDWAYTVSILDKITSKHSIEIRTVEAGFLIYVDCCREFLGKDLKRLLCEVWLSDYAA
jgi:hypothetical protein